jgi:hypothetical protein
LVKGNCKNIDKKKKEENKIRELRAGNGDLTNYVGSAHITLAHLVTCKWLSTTNALRPLSAKEHSLAIGAGGTC